MNITDYIKYLQVIANEYPNADVVVGYKHSFDLLDTIPTLGKFTDELDRFEFGENVSPINAVCIYQSD